jgi:hypothetical protein
MLDTPEQIAMWVLLSRRSQLKMQMKGLKVPGIVKWCRENIEGCENARTARDCVLPVEYAIASAGGPQDYSIVNVHVMRKTPDGLFHDRGIHPDMAAVEADPTMVRLYERGMLEIVYTMDEPRPSNGQIFVPA